MPKHISVITGAASGIGKACLKLFDSRGDKVIGIDSNALENIKKVDLSSIDEIKKLGEDLSNQGIKIDSIVHSAAIQLEHDFLSLNENQWDHVFNVNVKAIYFLTQTLFPLLNKNASIINISSVHSKATSKGLSSYVATKGAVSSLTRAMAIELGGEGIRVNSVLPGAIDTPMLQKGLSRNKNKHEALEKLKEASPIKCIGSSEDVAQTIYFLAHNEFSKNITGQEFICDSGVLAKLASE